MKKTQLLELFRNIKKTWVSYVSILIFVTLGVGMFTGMSWGASSIAYNMDRIMIQGNLHDLQIIFPYGLQMDDLEEIGEVEGVDEVEGVRCVYEFFTLNGSRRQAVLWDLPKEIDTFLECEGTLPTQDGEIAVSASWARENGLKIGDQITFEADNDGSARQLASLYKYSGTEADREALEETITGSSAPVGMAYLNQDTFVITALISSPLYSKYTATAYGTATTNQLPIEAEMYVAPSAWSEKADSGYTTVIIRSNELREYSIFSDEYKEKCEALKDRVSEAADACAAERCALLHSQSDLLLEDVGQQLEDGEKELEDAKKELDDARQALEDGEKELEDGETAIAEGEEELVDGYAQLQANQEKLDAGEQELLDSAEELLSEAVVVLSEETPELEDALEEEDPEAALELLELLEENQEEILDAIDQFIEAKEELEAGEEQMKAAREEFGEGLQTLEDSKDELEEGRTLLEENRIKYEDGLKEYEDGKKEYEEGLADYETLTEKLEELEDYSPGITMGCDNFSLVIAQTIAEIAEKLRYSLALLFVLVGFLVCYSALSRLVNDQMKQIGTKKALGLKQSEVISYYMVYTGAALLPGCILGIAAGAAIGRIMVGVLLDDVVVKATAVRLTPMPAILICAAEIVLLLAVAWFACAGVLKKNAIRLLAGPEPPKGKRRFYEDWKLWQKLPLLTRTIINNVLNDQRRVIGTLIGIMGCTSLIVMAMTLNNEVMAGLDQQMEEFSPYELEVYYDSDLEGAGDELRELLTEEGCSSTKVFFTDIYLKDPADDFSAAELIVPENPEEFKNFYKPIVFGSSSGTPYEGIWLNSSYVNYFGEEDCETIHLIDAEGQDYYLDLTGSYKSYIPGKRIFIDEETYEGIFDEKVESNVLLVSCGSCDPEVISEKLAGMEGCLYVRNFEELVREDYDMFKRLALVLELISLVLSVVMAFLVLLNLMTMFVEEKKKELIVLMINGYTVKDAKRYIYSDTILLTAVGILLGLILGTLTGNLIITNMESGASMFRTGVSWQALGLGALGTMILTFGVTLNVLKRIGNFNLTDINK